MQKFFCMSTKKHMRTGAALLAIVLAISLTGCARMPRKDPAQDFTGVPPQMSGAAQPEEQPAQPENAVLNALPYRAMWVSYLEWANLDTASEAAFAASAALLMENCLSLGLNCVIVQVRSFGDAIYPSKIFPWSHMLMGTQGQNPGYDPLAILLREAHERGIVFEAWINPYRVRMTDQTPRGNLAADNPALTHAGWAVEVDQGLYYNPALPEVQQMIVDGVVELLQNYDVDGIQFDDYFYPTTDASFDAESFAAMGNGNSLDAWRRENVNTLVRNVYAAIKREKPDVVFGISPAGNNAHNYNLQYCDVKLWLATPGYVDYIMPQVYWGYGYTEQNGSTQFAFENIVKEWAQMPRDASVSLAFGLGAYRVGVGDGGQNDQSQWKSGENLSKMVNTMATVQGAHGFALYRYDNLFHAGEYDALAQQERQTLQAAIAALP